MAKITIDLCQTLRKFKYFIKYINFKIYKFSTMSSVCQPAIRPDSISVKTLVFFTQQ